MTEIVLCMCNLAALATMKTATLLRMPADAVQHNSTFLKRKGGLFKKAHELSVLCSVDVAVFIFGQNKKLYEYSSCDMRELITRYTYVSTSPGCWRLRNAAQRSSYIHIC